jgi:hypothetical protein
LKQTSWPAIGGHNEESDRWRSRRSKANVAGRLVVMLAVATLVPSVDAAEPSGGAYTCVAVASNPPAPGLMLATREYVWTYYKPVMTVHRRPFVARTLIAKTQQRRWDYEIPTLRTERRVLWKYPQMTCRYPLGVLPNDCETVWHNAYGEFPVLATARDHVVVDVPAWTWEDKTYFVDVPEWSYVAQNLTIGVPALVTPESCGVFVGDAARAMATTEAASGGSVAPEAASAPPSVSIQNTRAGLESELASVVAALDQGIANIDGSIASIKASGGDPAQLASDNGKTVDMYALRATLVEQQVKARERFARMIDELEALGRPSGAAAP